ncbi:hypothetical protein ACF3NG_08025 [Aerococcaceae bacterium WGS1372]
MTLRKNDITLYNPKEITEIIDVPAMKFITIRCMGDPNEKSGSYAEVVSKLYAITCTFHMREHNIYSIEKFPYIRCSTP